MRILHTADWHLGKKLGRIDRRVEFEQVLDEIVAIAKDQKVDLTVVSGDLLDRAMPQWDALGLAIEGLVRLAEASGHLVAMPGNHDSAELFKLLGPLMSASSVTLVPRVTRPELGGVVEVSSRDGSETASVAVLPFLNEAEVIDFMDAPAEGFKTYADKIRLLNKFLCDGLDPKTVGILVGHFFVAGAVLGGGERTIHIGPQYAATPQSIPPGVHYAALGHIHKPQAIAGSPVPARYCGSLLQLDFSERTHGKEVVVVEASVGRPAKVRQIPLSSGRRLIRVEESLDGLESRVEELGDAYLDVRVKTEGPVFGILEQVRRILPNAVMAQAVWERAEEQELIAVEDRTLAEAYGEFHISPRGHGVAAPAELLKIVRDLEDATA